MGTSIKQYTCNPWTDIDNNETGVNKKLNKMLVTSVGGSASSGDGQYAPYQQLILTQDSALTDFSINRDYYLQLQIPRDPNYDMAFGLRLIDFKGDEDLDQITDHQLIRYITVNRQNSGSTPLYCCIYATRANTSTSWDDATTKTAIFEQVTIKLSQPLPTTAAGIAQILRENTVNPDPTNSPYANRGFFCKITAPIELDSEEYAEYKFCCYWLDDNRFRNEPQETLGVNGVFLIENWKGTSKKPKQTFKLVFRPLIKCNAIYLYLIPIPQDNDIQWLLGTSQIYYGRHIEDAENTLDARYREMPVFLDEGLNIKYFGVWGHPEQLMSVNGEEIRIGPSGYYELKNFDIDSLGIVCLTNEDKCTVDVQYEQQQ